jgi:hypothetical protein
MPSLGRNQGRPPQFAFGSRRGARVNDESARRINEAARPAENGTEAAFAGGSARSFDSAHFQ